MSTFESDLFLMKWSVFFLEIDRKEIVASERMNITDEDDLVQADFVSYECDPLLFGKKWTFRLLSAKANLWQNAFAWISSSLTR